MINGPKVSIVASTKENPTEAAALLIFTKQTRLEMNDAGYKGIIDRCNEDADWMMKELDYISKTIRSSWEFLDITFSIEKVSRACAQQITRTRFTPIDGDLFGSYAMQSQRVSDMSAMGFHNPIDPIDHETSTQREDFDLYSQYAIDNYQLLVQNGMKLEDARGILPMNLHCNLIAKYNLRMLADLIQARTSYRAQGEFQFIAAEMRKALVEMWPWASLFLRPKDELAKAAMEDLRTKLRVHCSGTVPERSLHEIMIATAKLDDLLQGGSK